MADLFFRQRWHDCGFTCLLWFQNCWIRVHESACSVPLYQIVGFYCFSVRWSSIPHWSFPSLSLVLEAFRIVLSNRTAKYNFLMRTWFNCTVCKDSDISQLNESYVKGCCLGSRTTPIIGFTQSVRKTTHSTLPVSPCSRCIHERVSLLSPQSPPSSWSGRPTSTPASPWTSSSSVRSQARQLPLWSGWRTEMPSYPATISKSLYVHTFFERNLK